MDVGDTDTPSTTFTPTDPATTTTNDDKPDPRAILQAVPTTLLRLLPALHSTQSLSETSYRKCAKLLRTFCDVLPQQQEYMLSVLAEEAVRLGRVAAEEVARCFGTAHTHTQQQQQQQQQQGLSDVSVLAPLASAATQALCVTQALGTLTGLESEQTETEGEEEGRPPPTQEQVVCGCCC